MSGPLNILVGGGTGFVGRHLVKCLESHGAKVQVISRDVRKNHISWEALEKFGLPDDVNSVINLAGRNIFEPIPWFESFKKEVYSSRIGTNKILVEAIQEAKQKPQSFIKVSGVGYYEPHEMSVYNEKWKQQGHTNDYLMNLARDWEEAGELDDESSKITRQVIIRSGVVLGSDGGLIHNLSPFFKIGLGQTYGSGSQWFPWIHVEDLADLFRFCVVTDNISGIINGVAPVRDTNKTFAEAFAKAKNTKVRIEMPSFWINLMFGQDRANIILHGQCVTTRAISLGFKFRYPTLEEAMQEIVKNETTP